MMRGHSSSSLRQQMVELGMKQESVETQTVLGEEEPELGLRQEGEEK